MKRHHTLVINELISGTCNGKNLAKKCNISLRTLRNYIKEINNEMPGLISSSHIGYSIDNQKAREFLNDYSNEDNENSYDRINYILNALINQQQTSINIYDLCDELNVSSSTINSDLQKIKNKLLKFNLQIKTKNNEITIVGLERDKRKLVSSILYDETNNNFIDFKSQQKHFDDINVPLIKKTVNDFLVKNNYYINDYSLSNLVLHIVISIDRIKHGNISSVIFNTNSDVMKSKAYRDAESLSKLLSKHFNVLFNKPEIYELTLLILTRASQIKYKDINASNIEQYLDKGHLGITSEIINKLQDIYGLDLSSEDFRVRFSIHLQDLFLRSQNQHLSKNPLTDNIRKNCPFLYDVAVTVAGILKTNYSLDIDDNEIAYIAIHIGSLIEEQSNIDELINTVIYYPNYYDMSNTFLEELNNKYGDELQIRMMTGNIDDIASLTFDDADLIISILNIESGLIPVVEVSPFLTNKDHDNIRKRIDFVKTKIKRGKLKFHLNNLFKEDLFEVVDSFNNQYECIEYMCKKYAKQHYTSTNIYNEVLARENVVSTAIDKFAIPHSMEMTGNKTALNVIITKKPISWGEKEVSLVIMLSFNKNDRRVFNKVYDPLVTILSEPENVNELIKCRTYDEYINTICSQVERL